MSGIFISYRRDDAKPYASRLCEHLNERFGEANVFLDKKIVPGDDFVRRIHERVNACDVMLHLVGPRWLALRPDGHSRLDDPDDFVRLELECALEAGVRLIPVLVDGAEMPAPQQVPSHLRPFLRKHAHALDDDHWDYDLGTLDRLLDDTLGRHEDAPRPAPPTPGLTPRRAFPIRLALGIAALLAGGVAALALWPAPAPAPPGPRTIRADTFAVGDEPIGIAASDGGVWVAHASGEKDTPIKLTRVDRFSGKTVGESIGLRGNLPSLAVRDGRLWATDDGAGAVRRIDPTSGAEPATPVDGTPIAIAVSSDSVWVSTVDAKGSGSLVRLDPRSGRPAGEPVEVGMLPWGVAVGAGAVWVANYGSDTVTRVDPETGRTRSFGVGDQPRGIAVDASGIWVTNSGERSVSHVDPETGAERRITVGDTPQGIAIADGSVWVANEGSDTVTRIDAATQRAVGDVKTGESPTSVAADAEYVWVANERGDSVTRLTF